MIPTISIPKQGRADANTERQRKVIDKGSHPRTAFSRAPHFALVFLPVALGVGYAMFRDAEGSILFRLGVYSMFLFGLGGAVSLLYCVGLVEDWEERNNK